MRLELYLSSAAVVISIFALALSYWQLEIGRDHNRKSIRPMVIVTPHLTGKNDESGVFLANVGLGPAVLKNFSVSIEGKTYETLGKSKWSEMLKSVGLKPVCFKQGWPQKESVIQVGEQHVMLAATSAKIPACELQLAILLTQKTMKITVEYASLYGETYEATTSTQFDLGSMVQ